jgi:hypothetical protein
MSGARPDDEADDPAGGEPEDVDAPMVFRQLLEVRIFLILCAVVFTLVALRQVLENQTVLNAIAAMVVILISYGAILSAVRERVEIRADDTVRVVRMIGAEQVHRSDIRAVRRRGGGKGGKSPILELGPPPKWQTKSMKPGGRGAKGAPAEPSAHQRLGGVLALPTLNYQRLADALGVEYIDGKGV